MRVSVIAKKAASYGIARIRVDGGAPVNVDLYSSTTQYKQTVWSSACLAPGTHTLTVEWTGTKRTAATNTNINVDALDLIGILPDAAATTTTTTAGTTTTTVRTTGKTYYVDATGGNDANTGLSPDVAWKTLDKVNRSTFGPGDSILFKRGEVFRGQFYLSNAKNNGAAGAPITFDAYGSGAKPVWMGSVDLSSTASWTSRGSNIWRASGLPSDVGNLICNNEAKIGYKKSSLTNVTSQGDFYYSTSGDYIDMYSVGNPGTYYSHIEASQKLSTKAGWGGNVIEAGHSYITFRNIAVKYQGWHGLVIGENSRYVVVERCDFSWCGGSYESEGGSARDGNGIMTTHSQSDITIRDNTFQNIWEVSISLQCWDTMQQTLQRVYIYRNLIANSRYSGAELWVASGTSATSKDIYWCNNVFYNIGTSVLTTQESGANAMAFSFNRPGTVTSAHILNNIFLNASGWFIYYPGSALSAWDIDYNDYYADGPYFMLGSKSLSFSQWKTSSGKDAHSVALDPKFADAAHGDFHLSTGSPCIGTGTAVTTIGQPAGVRPNMGVYY